MAKCRKTLDKLDNLWILGPPNSGKTAWVLATFPEAYFKSKGNCWDKYNEASPGHKVVIVDDLKSEGPKKNSMKAHNLNRWADHYTFPAEVRRGRMMIRPDRIIVTSRLSPEEIFTDKKAAKQHNVEKVLRRFKVVKVEDLSLPTEKEGCKQDAPVEEGK